MNHNILALIANKTSSLLDDDLIRLIGDIASVSSGKCSQDQYDNLVNYMREKPYNKELFRQIFLVIHNSDKKSISRKEDMHLLYYRELYELDTLFYINSCIDFGITNIENISKYLEERGITEIKSRFLDESTVLRIIMKLPDDYDNMKVLSLLSINISILYRHYHGILVCNKVAMMCKKVEKEIKIE